MTDRPILFSAPMIRAILREIEAPGTGKTQTRRVLQHHSDLREPPYVAHYAEGARAVWIDAEDNVWSFTGAQGAAVGDRLWVREAWCLDAQMDHVAPSKCSPYEPRGYPANNWIIEPTCMMIRAGKLRPGIHMPRWASRLTLHVTDVRVQRLQDISEDDAVAEGCTAGPNDDASGYRPAVGDYADLWGSLNAERAPWASNPWVVAITFRPALGNIDTKEMEHG